MTQTEQRNAARKFSENWKGKGYEKGDSQKFWIDLLCNVYGLDVKEVSDFVQFESQIKEKFGEKTRTITNFIDVYIPETRVMIEQKSSDKDLKAAIKQSDGSYLTPFQQARRYISSLPVSLHPRYVVTCNFKEFLVYDMDRPNDEPEEILLGNLEKEFYRLSFLVDTKSNHIKRELEVSKKAGELVGQIYDKILLQYRDFENPSEETLKSLNMLCVRLVFCLYAEDSGIFGSKSMFGDYLRQFEVKDLRRALLDLFAVLDQDPAKGERDEYLEPALDAFPYVNGGLFTVEDRNIPQFTDEIKELLVNYASKDFNWADISPTIFGAIFESTLNPETRRSGGMHYTSIENIHKVIDPLFLDDLKAEFAGIKAIRQVKSRNEKLLEFQKKLGSLSFLDPACGSGNFLTETYISLRRLENECIKLRFIERDQNLLDVYKDTVFVSIHQFYGIEINDFAVVVAKTALWIAESRMLSETSIILGRNLDFLPLKSYANITEGNALRLDWSTFKEDRYSNFVYVDKLNVYKTDMEYCDLVARASGNFKEKGYGCRNTDDYENLTTEDVLGEYRKELNVITKNLEEKNLQDFEKDVNLYYDYIIGNPPFVGYSLQTEDQKKDVLNLFTDEKGKVYKTAGKIDYVASWYFKASKMIQRTNTRCAFVSTNSIVQGEQVAYVWKPIFERFNIHFDFAYRSFKWENETADLKEMAAVWCVIIGFSSCSSVKEKKIYSEAGRFTVAKNINPYLIDSENVFIESRVKPLCNVPSMASGGKPVEGGRLIFTAEEKLDFLRKEPKASKYFREFMGSDDYINGYKRYCLWLLGVEPSELKSMPNVMKRVEDVRQFRLSSVKSKTREFANYPYQFMEIKQLDSNYLLIPATSTSGRRYVPMGFIDKNVIPSNATSFVPGASLYEFGVLTSNVHMAWMRVVCGRLGMGYRYSVKIVYNNFPWCNPTDEQKAKIEKTSQAILDARALYQNSTLADLYDETLMPSELRKAHQDNDKAVMSAYGFNLKMTESECVGELFKMYRQLVQNSK